MREVRTFLENGGSTSQLRLHRTIDDGVESLYYPVLGFRLYDRVLNGIFLIKEIM